MWSVVDSGGVYKELSTAKNQMHFWEGAGAVIVIAGIVVSLVNLLVKSKTVSISKYHLFGINVGMPFSLIILYLIINKSLSYCGSCAISSTGKHATFAVKSDSEYSRQMQNDLKDTKFKVQLAFGAWILSVILEEFPTIMTLFNVGYVMDEAVGMGCSMVELGAWILFPCLSNCIVRFSHKRKVQNVDGEEPSGPAAALLSGRS
jgi:hypothetical protein